MVERSESESGSGSESEDELASLSCTRQPQLPRGIVFQPRARSRVSFSGDRGPGWKIVVLEEDGSRRRGDLFFGDNGIVVDFFAPAPNSRKNKLELLAMPSVQVLHKGCSRTTDERLFRITGSWPGWGVSLIVDSKKDALELQWHVFTCVQRVSVSLHHEAPRRARFLDLGSARADGLEADRYDDGELLCAGYVVHCALPDWSALDLPKNDPRRLQAQDEATQSRPRFSLCYMELRGPNCLGDACAFLYESHTEVEGDGFHQIVWPPPDEKRFSISGSVVRIGYDGSEAQATRLVGNRDSRSPVASGWGSAGATRGSASSTPFTVPMADHLGFRTIMEAKAWKDLAASVYLKDESARRRARAKVEAKVPDIDQQVKFGLHETRKPLLRRTREATLPEDHEPTATDEQAMEAREQVQQANSGVRAVLQQMREKQRAAAAAAAKRCPQEQAAHAPRCRPPASRGSVVPMRTSAGEGVGHASPGSRGSVGPAQAQGGAEAPRRATPGSRGSIAPMRSASVESIHFVAADSRGSVAPAQAHNVGSPGFEAPSSRGSIVPMRSASVESIHFVAADSRGSVALAPALGVGSPGFETPSSRGSIAPMRSDSVESIHEVVADSKASVGPAQRHGAGSRCFAAPDSRGSIAPMRSTSVESIHFVAADSRGSVGLVQTEGVEHHHIATPDSRGSIPPAWSRGAEVSPSCATPDSGFSVVWLQPGGESPSCSELSGQPRGAQASYSCSPGSGGSFHTHAGPRRFHASGSPVSVRG